MATWFAHSRKLDATMLSRGCGQMRGPGLPGRATGRWSALITADHGNADLMVDPTREREPHTYHTLNPVPFILVTPDDGPLRDSSPRGSGRLCDIRPDDTGCVLDIDSVPDMTCHTLIKH